jgi:hypothetical protein
MAKPGETVSEHISDLLEGNDNVGQMGAARAVDVTPGGDREFGLFGQEQSLTVQLFNNDYYVDLLGVEPGTHYGEWLHNDWFA